MSHKAQHQAAPSNGDGSSSSSRDKEDFSETYHLEEVESGLSSTDQIEEFEHRLAQGPGKGASHSAATAGSNKGVATGPKSAATGHANNSNPSNNAAPKKRSGNAQPAGAKPAAGAKAASPADDDDDNANFSTKAEEIDSVKNLPDVGGKSDDDNDE